jgi:hypothetical protein
MKLLAIPTAIIAISFFGVEAGNINQAIKLVKMIEEDSEIKEGKTENVDKKDEVFPPPVMGGRALKSLTVKYK